MSDHNLILLSLVAIVIAFPFFCWLVIGPFSNMIVRQTGRLFAQGYFDEKEKRRENSKE